MKTYDSNNYTEDFLDQVLEKKWTSPHINFQFCEDHCLVKIQNNEIRVKEKTIKALKVLTFGFRFQKDSKILPTKEDFMLACGIPENRNIREFKIIKDLFPYPELRQLVRFDRKRRGYYLCLS